VTAEIPAVPVSAARSCCAASALPTTWTGSPAPAAKWRASTCSPVTASGLLRKASLFCRPLAFSPVSPNAIAASTTAVTTQVSRGRRAMRAPIRAHSPRSVGSADPSVGRTGQNIHRPKTTSSAGSSVTMAPSPTAMPIAITGPRLLVEASSATSRHKRLRITVDPLARIAGPARPSATAMAWCRSAWRRSSSR
jgi:hypothetical protein